MSAVSYSCTLNGCFFFCKQDTRPTTDTKVGHSIPSILTFLVFANGVSYCAQEKNRQSKFFLHKQNFQDIQINSFECIAADRSAVLCAMLKYKLISAHY